MSPLSPPFVGLLALLALPASAQSGCIIAADLADGVRLDFANSDVTRVRALGEGIFVIDEIYDDGQTQSLLHGYLGTYNFWWIMMSQGVRLPETETRVDWGMPVTDLPTPSAEAATITTDITTYDSANLPIDRAEREIRFAAGEPLIIDGCRYDTVTVGMMTTWSNGSKDFEFWTYLPESGLSYIIGWTDAEGEYVSTSVTGLARL